MTRSLESYKSSLRAILRKLEDIRMDAALIVGILPLQDGQRMWVAEQIDWTDKRLDPLREEYFHLTAQAYKLSKKVGRLEAIKNNELDRWEAEEIAYGWLNVLGDKGNDWLKEHHLTTISLTDAILKNPNFLEEVL